MEKRLIERIKYWLQILLLPVYWFSFLIPRNKKIWLFGSTFGRRFADNPRYFYLYLTEHPELNIRPIWISGDKEVILFLTQNGKEAYYSRSFMGFWFCMRGKVYLYDNYPKDISHWLSGGAVKINLWHGTGNKRANHDNLFDTVRHPRNMKERWKTFPRRLTDEKPCYYTLATSDDLAEITKSAFNTTLDHVLIDGYPRNDSFLDTNYPRLLNEVEKLIVDKILDWKTKGYIIDFYMPTFRDSEKIFFDVMNLEKYNQFLCENSIVFLIKLHPKSKLKNEFAKIVYSNIHTVDASIDPYIFMEHVDILTSDYSSVYSDFMLLNRPVVAFHYDFAEYINHTRDCYVPFEEYMPELCAKNMQELMEYTLQALRLDPCAEKRSISCKRMFSYKDANATLRLIEKIKKVIFLD